MQPCAQPGLLEHKHGLCAVLGRQVETVSEVVLSPQEGIEVIRNQQDLWGRGESVRSFEVPPPKPWAPEELGR